ncbi:PilN family type IV pilus biogenesis protein [mine drainage metagenome]|uniref:PilN family type IV pilus biogenesis protein n=2 Tax=mine drainage metagenome TaxID=410659 RepID=T0ZW53_9ZZZZ
MQIQSRAIRQIERRDHGLSTTAATQAAFHPVTLHAGYYFGNGQPIRTPRRARLPGLFKKPVVWITHHLYLEQVADRLSRLTGLPVRLGAILEEQQSANANPVTQKSLLLQSGRILKIDYRGTLAGLLDEVTAYFGLSWRWQRGAIRLFRYESRVFPVDVLPGAVSTAQVLTNQSNLGSSGSATGGSSETSSQMVTQSQDNQFWKTVHANVQAMLTQHGQALVNEEAGVITVIDRPMIVRRIGRYLAALDRAMQREVSIVVRVYALDLTNSELRGFSLNGVFNNLARNYGVTFAGAAPATSVSGAASLSATILNTAAGGIGQYAGSSLLAQVLDTYGHVSLMTQGSGIALQGQPLPIEVTKTVGYLASAETTASTLVGQSTALTPGQVTTGFSMIVVPRILPGGSLAMQYAVDLSTLNSLTTINSGGESIQVPSVSSQRFIQRVRMKSGQTLVLAGFEQVSDDRQGDRGILSWFRSGSDQRKVIFVTLTVRRIRV